jgi:carbon storage regulator
MQHLLSKCCVYEKDREVMQMLRLTLSTEEYLMLGDDIKVVFLGGTGNHLRIMIDAPRDVNIVRSSVLEKNDPDMKYNMTTYYAEPDTPKRYLKKKGTKTN